MAFRFQRKYMQSVIQILLSFSESQHIVAYPLQIFFGDQLIFEISHIVGGEYKAHAFLPTFFQEGGGNGVVIVRGIFLMSEESSPPGYKLFPPRVGMLLSPVDPAHWKREILFLLWSLLCHCRKSITEPEYKEEITRVFSWDTIYEV